MIVDATTRFATTTSGAIVIPVIAGLLVVSIVGAFAWLRNVTTTLRTQNATLADIKGEVQTNGGGSLKDAVLRVCEKQDATSKALDLHIADANYQRGRMDAAIEKVNSLPN